jgi:CheY-like chemotaxis protein
MTRDLGPRILCVGGSSEFIGEMESVLGSYGIEVVTATHGIDALMQSRSNGGEFAAVIVAYDLIGMDGVSFVSELLELGYQGRVLVKGRDFTLATLRAYECLPIGGFFSKPFDGSMLAALLMHCP